MEYNIYKIYLLPKNNIDILNDNLSTIREDNNIKTFNYNINNVTFSVHTTKESIDKLIIVDNNITYELEVKIIN